jgi:hypothetical protein
VRFLVVVVVVLLAAGCGDDDTTTATTAASATGCTPATSDLMTPLANKLALADTRLANGQIVKSAEHDDVYFVAAEIDSPELPNAGDVGIWATTSPHGAEAIYSVNDVAKQYSVWRDARAIDVVPGDPAAAEARACVFR